MSKRQVLDRLRTEAEKLYNPQADAEMNLPPERIKQLFQEIQLQQIELEMQNDELKISNEEVEAQRIKFTSLYDLAPVGYFILDSSGLIEEVNYTAVKLLNTNRRMVLKRRFQNFIQPEDAQAFYSFIQRMLASATRQSCQLAILSPSNETLYAQVEGTAVRSNFIDKTQCYLAVIDITERRKAEIKQRETMERLALALDASSTGTWEIDIRTGKVYMDDFCRRICGMDRAFDGTIYSFLKIIHPDDRKRVEERLRLAINGNTELDIEFRILTPERATRTLNARGHVVPNNKGGEDACFVGVLTDITEKKQLERDAQTLKINQQKAIQVAALQAQENERQRISETLHDSVSQLLYGAKLKIEHHKDALTKFPEIFTQIKGMLDQAIKETRNISFELAPSILKDFGLASTLEEMANRLCTNKLVINTHVDCCTELPLSLQTSIFRIVQELTNNSIKHSGATEINIRIAQTNKSLAITVTDNGKGFGDMRQETGGSGLASIKNRVSLFNGKIKIESKAGAKVSITLKV